MILVQQSRTSAFLTHTFDIVVKYIYTCFSSFRKAKKWNLGVVSQYRHFLLLSFWTLQVNVCYDMLYAPLVLLLVHFQSLELLCLGFGWSVIWCFLILRSKVVPSDASLANDGGQFRFATMFWQVCFQSAVFSTTLLLNLCAIAACERPLFQHGAVDFRKRMETKFQVYTIVSLFRSGLTYLAAPTSPRRKTRAERQ